MEHIIDAVSPDVVEGELHAGHFMRHAVNAGTEIYHFRGPEAPNALRELGRLRELSFRAAGGGTGKALDIDEWDEGPDCYTQLVVWDPAERMILGGYRYKLPTPGKGGDDLATRELFNFSGQFVQEFLPWTIELGRSFVQPEYQSSRLRRKGLYALDNLWDGLGGLLALNPQTRYFFGKVTMYTSYNQQARNALLHYLGSYYPDRDALVTPIVPLSLGTESDEEFGRIKHLFEGKDAREGYEVLQRYLQEKGERVPPLIKSYMGLSDTMRMFGTALNPGFGGVEETGILVTVADIHKERIERYVGSYLREKQEEKGAQ